MKGARALGSRLVVVVARDSNAGRELWRGEEERRKAVAGLPFVDEAVLGSEKEDKYAVLRGFEPAVVALGYDQKADEEKIKENATQGRIVRLKAFKPEKFKSSIIKELIGNGKSVDRVKGFARGRS